MQLGMIGLGRMGANMVRRLMHDGHRCIGFDLNDKNTERLKNEGVQTTSSLESFVALMRPPRVVWCMIPAGPPTEKTIAALGDLLEPGDTIIDGGNTYYKDDVRRAQSLAQKRIDYVDVGTSGGVWGVERGYCLMIGGSGKTVKMLDPVFKTLAPGVGDVERTPGRVDALNSAEQGYLHCGPVGAGHFVKMIHNGIEYGLMQAYAEGFDILRNADSEHLPEALRYDFDLKEITEVWRRGSVVGSWLLDLTAIALMENPNLSDYSGYVQDSGEGRWTVQAAIEEAVPADVLSAALYTRFRSRQEHTFAEKVLSAMRHKFGGHTE
ncbi:MAG: phosphogluconate dehydrogenase (NAD(+)-dependent, decarboxylating) [Pseudomonadota bacterium]